MKALVTTRGARDAAVQTGLALTFAQAQRQDLRDAAAATRDEATTTLLSVKLSSWRVGTGPVLLTR